MIESEFTLLKLLPCASQQNNGQCLCPTAFGGILQEWDKTQELFNQLLHSSGCLRTSMLPHYARPLWSSKLALETTSKHCSCSIVFTYFSSILLMLIVVLYWQNTGTNYNLSQCTQILGLKLHYWSLKVTFPRASPRLSLRKLLSSASNVS